MTRKKGTPKDPARVKAGKKAWDRMSASAKAKVVARLAPFRKHKGTSRSSGSNPTRSHASHGGGSTPKSAPKPRLGILVGAAGSVVTALGYGDKPALEPVFQSSERKATALGNAASITQNREGAAVAVAAPALIGVGVSWAADKLGVNRVLAKARAPFRI